MVSYIVKRYTKQDKRERSLLSGMFPQAATNNTFAPSLCSLFALSQRAREDTRKGKRAIDDL